MYVTSADELSAVLAERTLRQDEIRSRVASFFERNYGIEGDYGLLGNRPESVSQRPVAILARQIASICVEDIAFTIAASRLGLSSLTATFVRDSFTQHNHDKVSRAKIPWIEWSKKGNLVLRHEQRSKLPHTVLDGVPLEDIECGDGQMLPEYHLALRARMGLAAPVADISDLHARMLHRATFRPQHVFRKGGDRARKHLLVAGEGTLETDRPPASWYYPYYLSWFLDGSAVLFETYENPEGGVPEAKRLFEQCMERVVFETGFRPIIVRIPPLTKDMLYCNLHLLAAGSSGLERLITQTEAIELRDTEAGMRSIADAVIAFR